MVMIPELVDLEEDLMERPIQERFEDLAQALRDEGHEELEVRRIVRAVGGSGFNLNLFPNIACSMAFFRVLQPISVAETEIHHSVITMDGGPQIANQYRLRLHEHFQGPLVLARQMTLRLGNAYNTVPMPVMIYGSCSTAVYRAKLKPKMA